MTIMVSLVAGCGGGNDGASDNSVPTKAEFVKRANAVCRRETLGLPKEVSSYLERFKGVKPPRILYAQLAQIVLMPPVEDQTDSIRALDMPPGDEERIDEMLFADQLAVDRIATTTRIASIGAAKREFIEADKLFRAYGLVACTNGPKQKAKGT